MDPRIGRFITQDPLGMIDGPNLYAYVNNNPINWIDPYGLEKEKKWKWGQENWLWQILYGYNLFEAEPNEDFSSYLARFRAEYPYQFAASETFGFLSLGGWALSGGVEAGYRVAGHAAQKAFTSLGWESGAYVHGYHAKLTLNQAQGGFRGASAALLGIGIAATSYRAGLQLNAWLSYNLTRN